MLELVGQIRKIVFYQFIRRRKLVALRHNHRDRAGPLHCVSPNLANSRIANSLASGLNLASNLRRFSASRSRSFWSLDRRSNASVVKGRPHLRFFVFCPLFIAFPRLVSRAAGRQPAQRRNHSSCIRLRNSSASAGESGKTESIPQRGQIAVCMSSVHALTVSGSKIARQ